MRRKYSEEVKKFIAENVQGTRIKDLVKTVNAKFGTEFTRTGIIIADIHNKIGERKKRKVRAQR